MKNNFKIIIFDKYEKYAIIKIEIRRHKSGRQKNDLNAHSIQQAECVFVLFLFT